MSDPYVLRRGKGNSITTQLSLSDDVDPAIRAEESTATCDRRIKSGSCASFIFDEVEVLDFCGPFEVLLVTGGRQGLTPFEVCTVAEEQKPVKARDGLGVNAAYGFKGCPRSDILLITSWARHAEGTAQCQDASLDQSLCGGCRVSALSLQWRASVG